MIRDSRASHDGWFWGWFGWNDWQPDWPQRAQRHAYPFMGFGQYCTNCHASAKDHQTFSSLKNIKGEPGEPLVFLSQNFFLDPSWQSLQNRIAQSEAKAQPRPAEGPLQPGFCPHVLRWGDRPDRACIVQDALGLVRQRVGQSRSADRGQPVRDARSMPRLPQRRRHRPAIRHDRCPAPTKLINISPYGTWSGSPMGLSGRDPVFFAQLASEAETFHPSSVPMIADTCLGCHGIRASANLPSTVMPRPALAKRSTARW